MTRIVLSSALCAVALAGTVSAGEISARGSDSTLTALEALSSAFAEATGHTVKVEGGGSSNGAKAALAGEVDLGFMSRAPKSQEVTDGLVGVQYAIDGVAIIVNSQNTQTDFTVSDLHGIYTGENRKWGNGKKILALNHPKSSGTRECFEGIVMGDDAYLPIIKNKHESSARTLVTKLDVAIYYTSAGAVDADSPFTVCTMGGVAPSTENIQTGTYPLTRPLFLATKGDASGVASEFIEFALSPKGQAIVARVGFVPVNPVEAAAAPPEAEPEPVSVAEVSESEAQESLGDEDATAVETASVEAGGGE